MVCKTTSETELILDAPSLSDAENKSIEAFARNCLGSEELKPKDIEENLRRIFQNHRKVSKSENPQNWEPIVS